MILCAVGLLYVRFAFEERNVFRFLFYETEFDFQNRLLDSDELSPILFILQRSEGITMEQARDIVAVILIIAHGMACFVACGAMEFNHTDVMARLKNVYSGAIYMVKSSVGV